MPVQPGLDEVVAKGTVVVLDGGLATELERRGADLSGALWSARVLRDDPAMVHAVHAAFFEAGAQVATTATYQLTRDSLRRAGADAREVDDLVARACHLARTARDAHRSGWVVGSVGPFGASRADGSEYTGAYGLDDDAVGVLRNHHRHRLAALLASGVDALAIETLPSLAEAEAVAAELTELQSTDTPVPVWFSFTPAPGGRSTRTGERLDSVAGALSGTPGLVAVGVNCCRPVDVVPALRELRDGMVTAPDPPSLIAYPNGGQTWNPATRQWQGTAEWSRDGTSRWREAGAILVGGCCRVGPDDIRDMVATLTNR